jgi:hypothetical protein
LTAPPESRIVRLGSPYAQRKFRVMDATGFDRLTRTLAHGLSRRGLAGALGLVVAAIPGLAAAKKRRKKKLKKNQFGCVDVGKACRGKDSVCCSGICQGKKPKKGKKDKSTCAAHDVLDCAPGANSCDLGEIPCGTNGVCLQTTGKASFCGTQVGECAVCRKDTDCEAVFGPGAACVVCLTSCEETGFRICITAASP